MSFLPLYGSDRSSTPLFRLVDGFDICSWEAQDRQSSRRCPDRLGFSPKFDVRETEGTYELYGELPGVERDNLQIEFSDLQTLVVRGRVERANTTGTPAAGPVESPDRPQEAIAAFRRSDAGLAAASHQATVEEATDDESTGQATPAGTPEIQAAEPDSSQDRPKDTAEKYWLAERSGGEFSRNFSFHARVDQDSVKANLNSGVLTIVVPKAKKHEPRRITIA